MTCRHGSTPHGNRRTTTHVHRAAVAVVLAIVALGACSSGGSGSSGSLNVVVSDPPLTDLVRRVAGDGVDVVGLVPLGADGHTYEPRPADARKLARADLYIENGLGLNASMTEFAGDNLPEEAEVVLLAQVVPFDEVIPTESPEQIAAHGHAHSFNPHFWLDPTYAARYVVRIEEALSTADPGGADGYKARAAALEKEILALDDAFKAAIETIPPDNRKLVVYHDSWSYFGRRYGLPVLGAIQPTDFSEPSAAEVRRTIDQVKAANVPAFFGSEVFPSNVLDAIAEETGARYVADLSDDRLPGEPGDPRHGYVGMMVENTGTIVRSLGGDPAALEAVDPSRG